MNEIKNFWLMYFYILCGGSVLGQSKLNVPRILLPPSHDHASSFQLVIYGDGCYKWHTSDSVIHVVPVKDKQDELCSKRADVFAVTKLYRRQTAVIFARNEITGEKLKCDIIIDVLHSIEIITTTKILYNKDNPEMFEVVAKNKQGDKFSSLNGISFIWSIHSHATEPSASILKFAESAYKIPVEAEYFERLNMYGSKILLIGRKTGVSTIKVRPLAAAYKNIASFEVNLITVDNLSLKPSYINVLPGMKLKFELEVIKQGKVFPIILPSVQYFLESEGDVISVDNKTSVITALRYGFANIRVKNKFNKSSEENEYLPTSVIRVTAPSYMNLSVSNADWNLEEKKNYFVSITVYDQNGYLIHITQDIRIVVQFPEKYFRIVQFATNGTFQEVQTQTSGVCNITAKLVGIITTEGILRKIKPVVSVSQEVIIYKSIRVHPPFTLLHWDPVLKPIHSINLKATGGTESFNWKCSDSSLTSVCAVYKLDDQQARMIAFGRGTFQVQVTDAHLTSFTGSAEVVTQPIIDMQIFPKEVEAEINSSLILPLAMYGYLPEKTAEMLSNCSEVPVIVDIDEIQKFIHVSDDKSPVSTSSCLSIKLKCIAKGFNRIHLKYESKDISIKKTIIIGCYRKLKAVYPSNEAVIAAGSSLNIIFHGGPMPWPRCHSYFVNHTPICDYVDVTVGKNKSDAVDIHKVHVLCKGYGKYSFIFTVGNRPCDSNLFPAINKASYRILCSMPEIIILRPVLQSTKGKKCPASGENLVVIRSNQDLQIELIVKDNAGRQFHNISSLEIKWFMSDDTLAHFTSNEGAKVKHIYAPSSYYSSKYFQGMHLYGPEGTLKVTASIIGYKSNYVKDLELINYKTFDVINGSLEFMLVDEPEIEPKKLSIFNSPSNKVYLNISKGSGEFKLEASNPKIASLFYNSFTGQVEITPLDIGTTDIIVTDLCIGVKYNSAAQIQIYGISAIVVDVRDKVQLGEYILATVLLINEENETIKGDAFHFIDIEARASSKIIFIKLLTMEQDMFKIYYRITGLETGITHFKVTCKMGIYKSIEYSSDEYQIEVFTPLHIKPIDILTAGAEFQVEYTGGPQPTCNMEFVIDNEFIALVSSNGIVYGKNVGKATLYCKCKGFDKNGNSIIFSETKTRVTVIAVNKIKIYSPLSGMVAGTMMPLHVMANIDQEKPITFTAFLPAATFTWTTSNKEVASLHNLYKSVRPQQTFKMVLKAHKEGLLKIMVKATLFNNNQVLSHEIEIEVYPTLEVIYPAISHGQIILTPNSVLKMKCNRSTKKINFKITSSENTLFAPVSVDESGNLKSSSETGKAVLTVTSIEKTGLIQQLSVIVKVAEIKFLLVNPINDWSFKPLYVGSSASFTISYYDDMCSQFDAVSSDPKIQPNRRDLLLISGVSNNTFIVKVLRPGYTILKVSIEEIEDVFLIEARSQPYEPVSCPIAVKTAILSDNERKNDNTSIIHQMNFNHQDSFITKKKFIIFLSICGFCYAMKRILQFCQNT